MAATLSLRRSSARWPVPERRLLLPSHPLHGERILIVDDNELSRNILSGMLREFQLDPVSAASVGEAVRLCRDAAREEGPIASPSLTG